MSFRAGLAVIATLLAGCSSDKVSHLTITLHAASGPAPGAGTCVANQPCQLTGTLLLQHRSATRSWAVISQNGACAPLLLSASVYEKWRRWNNKQVRASGTALARGPASDEIDQLQYRDRWLSPHICGESALTLYVDKLTLARGQ